MARDWVKFPELRNSELEIYYMQSPHKQILGNFRAKCVKVIDGDTIRVRWDRRDFDFPVRFWGTDAPELNQEGGSESQSWLESVILDEEIEILIDPDNRVGKFGRILGTIMSRGMNINEDSIRQGWATSFDDRNEGELPILAKELALEKWF